MNDQQEAPLRLSLAQVVALRYLRAQRDELDEKVGKILAEAGLKAGHTYHISEDGEASLVE